MTSTALRLLSCILIVLLTAMACGREGSPTEPGQSQVPMPVAQNVQVPNSPTFSRMTARGRVVIGIKNDQPGLGLQDATTGSYSGFDVDIARMIAAELGYDTEHIDFVVIPSAAREDAIARGDVDFYVGTYTINDKRKQRVAFAGPYLVTGQSLLVRADDTTIDGPQSLQGKKVCSVTGSTPIQRVRDQNLTAPSNIVEFQTYSQCVDQLLANNVDVVTTDQAALVGYAAQDPDHLKVVGSTFSIEPYGVGLARDDAALRTKINDILQRSFDDGTWQKIYDANLGDSGIRATPPQLQRY